MNGITDYVCEQCLATGLREKGSSGYICDKCHAWFDIDMNHIPNGVTNAVDEGSGLPNYVPTIDEVNDTCCCFCKCVLQETSEHTATCPNCGENFFHMCLLDGVLCN